MRTWLRTQRARHSELPSVFAFFFCVCVCAFSSLQCSTDCGALPQCGLTGTRGACCQIWHHLCGEALPVFIFAFTCQQNIFSICNEVRSAARFQSQPHFGSSEVKNSTRGRIDRIIVAAAGSL